ncbi:MAG: hypothetical protein M3N13_01880 [Candidatus Eremiobacteraeota bacterium]|nr:hypothetical protein [Candidatus Eremiobacteraeota bacterium]
MMQNGEERTYSAEQAATANTVLRAALGLPPQRFGAEQFVGMISDEIEDLRRSGKTDVDIARLIGERCGIDIDASSITQFYAPPAERGRPT